MALFKPAITISATWPAFMPATKMYNFAAKPNNGGIPINEPAASAITTAITG